MKEIDFTGIKTKPTPPKKYEEFNPYGHIVNFY